MHVQQFIVSNGLLAIDYDSLIATGLLNSAPFAARQVFNYMVGADTQILGVIHNHVSRNAHSQHPTVRKARKIRRQSREPTMRFFVGNPLIISYLFGQRLCWITASGQELGMGSTIAHAEEHVRVLHDLFQKI